jgi:hypothetical protein
VYSPLICLTTTSESENTCSALALSPKAQYSTSKSAIYSATLLSWCPIHFRILIVSFSDPSITTPIPEGPGFPSEPPST